MPTYNPIEIVKLYVFGTDTPSTDAFNQHIRPLLTTRNNVSKDYNMQDYMFSGAGRYAYPSLFKAIEKIFNANISDGIYDFEELKVNMGNIIISNDDQKMKISHYGTDILRRFKGSASLIFKLIEYTL